MKIMLLKDINHYFNKRKIKDRKKLTKEKIKNNHNIQPVNTQLKIIINITLIDPYIPKLIPIGLLIKIIIPYNYILDTLKNIDSFIKTYIKNLP